MAAGGSATRTSARASARLPGARSRGYMMGDPAELGPGIRRVHERLRDLCVAQCERTPIEQLARSAAESRGDTQYAIDRITEQALLGLFEEEVARTCPIVFIAEGLEE